MSDIARTRELLTKTLEMVTRIAEMDSNAELKEGMLKAIRIIEWRMIGSGEGCVITPLDPRRDDPEWQKIFDSTGVKPKP